LCIDYYKEIVMILLKDGHTECNVAVKKKLNTFFEIIGIRK